MADLYDVDALKADLPNAKELAQFVYDKTGLALDLIGKPKEEQYLAAKNALEGKKVPQDFITDDNPYVDKKDLIPVDEKSHSLFQGALIFLLKLQKSIILGLLICLTHLIHSLIVNVRLCSVNTTTE